MNPVVQYMAQIRDLKRSMSSFTSTEDFVLTHGREWAPAALPKGIRRGRMRMCFKNAAELALHGTHGLTYVEGYALSVIIPVTHAWCVDAAGNVVDPTWPDSESCHYFGIPFDTEFLRRFILRSECWGLLEAYWIGFPLQRGEYTPAEFISKHHTKHTTTH